MLAKLNDGIEFSEKEINGLTWQEKTKLVQKDPITCSRYFDHRVQEFLNTVLKSACGPVGKVKDFFYRVEISTAWFSSYSHACLDRKCLNIRKKNQKRK